MGHFNIIQISSKPVPQEGRINEMNIYEDGLFLDRSDWGGDPVADDESAMESIARALSPIAETDVKARTITFRPKEEVARKYAEYVQKETERHLETIRTTGSPDWWAFHRKIENVFGISDLFWNDSCQCTGRMLEDYLDGWLPQTVHVGAILSAHC